MIQKYKLLFSFRQACTRGVSQKVKSVVQFFCGSCFYQVQKQSDLLLDVVALAWDHNDSSVFLAVIEILLVQLAEI